jgi:cell wall-associated NlpC family hydrolase
VAVLAVTGSVLLVGAPSSTAHPINALRGPERVSTRFIERFEGFSYRNPRSSRGVANLATPALAARLLSTPQAASGPELTAERFVTSVRVSGYTVERATAIAVTLLARTSVHTSTVHGSTRSDRLIPVVLVHVTAGWRVSDIGGIRGSARQAPAERPNVPAVPPVNAPPNSSNASTVSVVRSVGDIPSVYVSWTQSAVAAECPGLPWEVLAAIARVESDFGQSTLPGVSSGSNYAGAEGPMQFEPATFQAYGIAAPGGAQPASPYDPIDALYSAARLLCADGGGTPGLLATAIFDYNHSDAYVSLVLAYASAYQQESAGGAELTGTEGSSAGMALGSVVVADAEAYLGTPYVWGGEQPGVGFDCSGLVQWVYAEAGISLPRVAQDQYDVGPHLPAGATLYPGDLVFFGSGPQAVEHVGIYVGNGEMIDAPYTGVDVRFDRVSDVSLGFVGATRPEVPNLLTGAGVPVVGSAPSILLSDVHGTTGHYAPSTASPAWRTAHGGSSTTNSAATAKHHHHKRSSSSGDATSSTPSGARHGSGAPPKSITTTTASGRKVAPTTTTTAPIRKAPPTTTTTARIRKALPTTTTTQPPSTTVPPPVKVPTTTVPTVAAPTTTSLVPTTIDSPAASTTTPAHHRKGG